MLPLRCAYQNYDWGKEAQYSEVAKIARANGSELDESKPFAELWMGTHPKGPSVVASTGGTLQSWIEQHPESLGPIVKQRFGGALPFLFKILSVNKALSIQSHPDKELAERLHRENPEMYADDNHKPEMALAISDFEALCGFAPLAEIQEALRTVPELCMGVGEECTEAILKLTEPNKEVLKAAFTSLMESAQVKVEALVRSLVARLRRIESGSPAKRGSISASEAVKVERTASVSSHIHKGEVADAGKPLVASADDVGEGSLCSALTNANEKGSTVPSKVLAGIEDVSHCSTNTADEGVDSDDNTPTSSLSNVDKSGVSRLSAKEQLVLRLNSQFPADVGILSAFFLNLISLDAGEAIYLAANEPHAYLKGELVECMATSDNVIRAGLTPKFKDTEVLCESLSYEQGLPHVLKGVRQQLPQSDGTGPSGGEMFTYQPPFEEFEMQCVKVPPGCSSSLPVNQGPAIVLVLSGSGSLKAEGASELSSKQLGLQMLNDVHRGSILFVPAHIKLDVRGSSTSAEADSNSVQGPPLTMWIASVNQTLFGQQ